MATLGFAIIGVILINGIFSFWQAYRAEQALAVLKQLLPHSTKVLRSGMVRQLPAAELVPGDVVLLESGEILPADCRLVEAFGVRVNNATITGESLPVSRDADPSGEAEIMRGSNTLLAGTSMVSGEAKALVFATGAHSAFGRIATLTQATADTVSPLQTEILRVSRIVAGMAVGLRSCIAKERRKSCSTAATIYQPLPLPLTRLRRNRWGRKGCASSPLPGGCFRRISNLRQQTRK